MKPRIYIETTVISYLSSRPARDLRSAARQEWTHGFWEWATNNADLFTSELTRIEAGRGDSEAATKRLAYADVCTIVEETEAARYLSKQLIDNKAIPPTEPEDALHFAIATLAEIDYVASWNFSHLVGEEPKRKLSLVLAQLGYTMPMLATPESLLESLK
jgi:predicted nucleic acid-binding protein